MDYLEVIDGQGRHQRVALDRSHLIIGRDAACDIRLPHPAVSRRHAQLQSTEQGRWLLQDLRSRNHVYVKNRPVQQIVLEPGKQVRIAEYTLMLQPSLPTPDLAPQEELQDDTRDSWADLDRGLLQQFQVLQRTLLQLEEPRQVLERLADEAARVSQARVVAVGLATVQPYHWEVIRCADGTTRPEPDLQEAEEHLDEAGSTVQTWPPSATPETAPETPPSQRLLFPMRGRSGIIGHIYVQQPRVAPLPVATRRYLSIVATLAGLMWDNLQLAALRIAQRGLEQELCAARQIQVELFPASFEVDPRLDVFAVNLPSAQVSGDYYDLFRLGPHLIAFVIADAMGHGMAAALMMATVRAALRMGLSLGLSWKAVCKRLDDMVTQARANSFVTGIVGQIDLDQRRLQLMCAGHPLPSLLVDGRPVPIPPQCQTRPWGLTFDLAWEIAQVPLPGSWSILCYTDGILDAAARNERCLDGKQLCAYHEANHQQSAEDLCQGVLSEIAVRPGPVALYDDQTVLVLRSL